MWKNSAQAEKLCKEKPDRRFAGIDRRLPRLEAVPELIRLKNADYLVGEAEKTMRLMEPNSKEAIAMDSFPYWEVDQMPNDKVLRIFELALRALKPGRSLWLTCGGHETEFAVSQLKQAGFEVGRPREWTKEDIRYMDRFGRGELFSDRQGAYLIRAKKSRWKQIKKEARLT